VRAAAATRSAPRTGAEDRIAVALLG